MQPLDDVEYVSEDEDERHPESRHGHKVEPAGRTRDVVVRDHLDADETNQAHNLKNTHCSYQKKDFIKKFTLFH